MNARDVIEQVQEDAAEWLEMTDDKAALVAAILAQKIVKMTDYIQYLEKRLKHVSQQEITSHSRRI